MTEEDVRRAHRIVIDERSESPCWKARCSCKEYKGVWQEYKGIAVQQGRIHVQEKVHGGRK